MAGKSTYIRQAALITIMAQMGSFVPAKEALIGIADRVFARVGASDELARGQSTFMVEMTETARILNSATARSLVILDEIGRGTSTYDGISLAWAITEHLHDEVQCRTMFATHYHELTDLTTTLKHAANWNVAVQESNDDVVFLHRIVEGAAGRSYGIHVAKIAGVPRRVTERATTILATLEDEHITPDGRPKVPQRETTRRAAGSRNPCSNCLKTHFWTKSENWKSTAFPRSKPCRSSTACGSNCRIANDRKRAATTQFWLLLNQHGFCLPELMSLIAKRGPSAIPFGWIRQGEFMMQDLQADGSTSSGRQSCQEIRQSHGGGSVEF